MKKKSNHLLTMILSLIMVFTYTVSPVLAMDGIGESDSSDQNVIEKEYESSEESAEDSKVIPTEQSDAVDVISDETIKSEEVNTDENNRAEESGKPEEKADASSTPEETAKTTENAKDAPAEASNDAPVVVKKTAPKVLSAVPSTESPYKVIAGSSVASDLTAENLFDGDSTTDWVTTWTESDKAYVIFMVKEPTAIKSYEMTTASSGTSGATPAFWKLYGSNDPLNRNDSGWQLVDDKSFDYIAYGSGGAIFPDPTGLLGTQPNITKTIKLNNNAVSEQYKYFKLEIENIQGEYDYPADADYARLGAFNLIAEVIDTTPAVKVVADNGIKDEKAVTTFTAANVAGNLRTFIAQHEHSNITVDVLIDCNLGDLIPGEENDAYITINLNGHNCTATTVAAFANHMFINADGGTISTTGSDYLIRVESGTTAGFGAIGYGELSLNGGQYNSSNNRMFNSTSVTIGEVLGTGYIAASELGDVYTHASTEKTINAGKLVVYECSHPQEYVTKTEDGFKCSQCEYDSKNAKQAEESNMTEEERAAKAKSLYDALADSTKLLEAENSSASAKDPYGYGVGIPFLLSEESEVLFNRTSGGTSGMYWKDTIKNNNADTNINSDAAAGVYQSSGEFAYASQLKTTSFLQSVAFDPNGSGRKDHIAYIGVNSEKHVVVWIYDTKREIGSNKIDLGQLPWVTDKTYPFEMINYLAITAGDYNGNGREEIVAYTPGNGADYGLARISVSTSASAITLTKEASSAAGLLNPAYNNTSAIKNRSNKNGRDRQAVDLASGDTNGDGIDDLVVLSYLNRVSGDFDNLGSALYCPYLAVSNGAKDIGNIALIDQPDSRVAIRDGGSTDKDGVTTYVSMMAPGMDIGDLDGDGVEEIIVAGAYNTTETKKNSDAVDDAYNIDNSKLPLAAFGYQPDGKFVNMLFDMTSQSMPAFTKAGINTSDQVFAPVAVKTASMDGKGNAATVFIGGNLYNFSMKSSANTDSKTAANMSAGSLAPNKVLAIPYFQSKDSGCGNNVIDRNFVQSVAAGNFDGNKQGYEQLYYTVGLRVGVDHTEYSYLYGRAYTKARGESGLTSEYGCTNKDAIERDTNRALYNKNQSLSKPINFIVTACDKDDDGILARYNTRNITFADPQVLTVLQAVPYFQELEDAGYYDDPSGCAYSISESMEYTKGTSNSVSFGAGATATLEGTIGGFDVSAGYALDWSESYEKTLETESSIEFTATYYDQVVVGRTPVYVYSYDVWNGSKWEDNSLELSVAQAASYAPYTLDEYNMMAEYYNQKVQAKGGKSSLPVLDKESLFLGNEGDPFSYINTEKNKSGYTLLTNSKIVNRPVSGASAISYSRGESTTKTTEIAHGFTFDLTVTFGFDAGFVESKAGGFVNLQYMNGTSESETIGKSLEYTITGINPNGPAMQEDGISATTTNAYSYVMNLASWKDEASDTQIVGTALSNLSAPPLPVENLGVALMGTELVVSWDDTSTSDRPVDGYNVYLETPNGDWKKVNDELVTENEYNFRNYNNTSEYKFMVQAAHKNASGLEIESIPSEEISYNFGREIGPDNYRCLQGHSWTKTSETEATCYVAKANYYECSICGATKCETGAKLEHDMIDNVVLPTCISKGYTTHICKNCGMTKTDSITELGSHDYVEVVLIENTCTTDGKALKMCVNCRESSVVTIAKTGHSFTNYVYDDNATLSADGTKSAVCNHKCGAADTVTATGTKRKSGDSVTVDGAVYTLTSTGTVTCTSIPSGDEINIPETIVIGDAVLKVTDIAEGALAGKSDVITVTIESADTKVPCDAFEGCTNLESVTIGTDVIDMSNDKEAAEAFGHNYVVTKAAKAATCSEAGNKEEKTCKGCGEVLGGEIIPAKGHTEVIDAAVAAICETAGKTEGKHCSVCGKVLVAQQEVAAKGHTAVTDAAVAATCETAGKTEGKHCSVCGKVLVAQQAVDALGHKYETIVKKATLSENGKKTVKCSVCDEVKSTSVIKKVSSVKLATSSYAYSGKKKMPAVTVKNSAGTKLVKGTAYTVTYAKGCTNVGKYKVTVKGKGNYSFTKTVYFTIKPKATPIVKVTPGKKSFTIKWTKRTAQVTGYEVQYSTSSGFKSGNKTTTIKSYKTTSKTYKKLKAKKTYYVRVRTYKTVGKVKYYSAWSAKKKVVTK